MDNIPKTTIQEVITALLDDSQIFPANFLHHLSGLEGEALESLAKVWSQIDPVRRKALFEDMNTLAELDYSLDFTLAAQIGLGDPAADIRLAALELLYESDKKGLVQRIIQLVSTDTDNHVRAKAASVLGRYVYLGEMEEIDPATYDQVQNQLLEAYEQDGHTLVRRRALEALGFSCHTAVPDMITSAVESGNDDWLVSALFAMGRSGNARWESVILEHLNHSNLEVRREAIRAAGELYLDEAQRTLMKLLDEEDAEIRLETVWALSNIGGQGVRNAFEGLLEDCDDDEEADLITAAMDNLSFAEHVSSFDLLDINLDDLLENEEDWEENL